MRVFRDLDFLSQMEEAKFPHKFGAAWTAEDRGAYDMDFKGGFDGKGDNLAPTSHVDISFSERKQDGVDREYTLSRRSRQVRSHAPATRPQTGSDGVSKA